MKFIILAALLAAPLARATELCAISTVSVRMTAPAPDLVQFEFCENGICRALGEGTGVYHSRDLQAQQKRLTDRANKPRRAAAIRALRYTIGGACGIFGLSVVGFGALEMYHVAYTSFPFELILDSLASAALSVPSLYAITALTTSQNDVYSAKERVRAEALEQVLRAKFATMNETELRGFAQSLKYSLYGLKPLSECEMAALTPPK